MFAIFHLQVWPKVPFMQEMDKVITKNDFTKPHIQNNFCSTSVYCCLFNYFCFFCFVCRGESSDVNIILWNTIQHMFPREVEARKAANALSAQPCETSNRSFFGQCIFHDLLDVSRRGTFHFEIKTENFSLGYTLTTNSR